MMTWVHWLLVLLLGEEERVLMVVFMTPTLWLSPGWSSSLANWNQDLHLLPTMAGYRALTLWLSAGRLSRLAIWKRSLHLLPIVAGYRNLEMRPNVVTTATTSMIHRDAARQDADVHRVV